MRHETDILVIGGGVAGLMFALKVAPFGKVTVITKKKVDDSNTNLAQGGIASVLDGVVDSFDAHIQDTLASGDGLSDRQVVDLVVKSGPERIQELIDLGVQFNIKESATTQALGDLDLGREGGHSQNRIVHAQDMTGRELQRVLTQHARENDRITLLEDHAAVDLITRSTRIRRGLVTTAHEETCCGAYVLNARTGAVDTVVSKITMLASGGAGKVYLYTSNPDVATGDGIAMAYRAGATVANLEFVQFHPTCLYHPEAKNFLISEAVRGEGGVLLNARGEAFMGKYDPLKDLACRDVVARAIDRELKKSGDDSVFLDITHQKPKFIKTRFPNLYAKCLSFGIDMTKDPIPVVPAAHYMCGGVATDLTGMTDIKRLYAIGETACTGLHGANRLASNSLIEALVFAHTAAKQVATDLAEAPPIADDLPEWNEVGTTPSDEVIMVSHNWDEIRRLMWNYVGIVRSNKRLDRARRRIEIIQDEIRKYYWDFKVDTGLIELRNIATVAELIVKCAQYRQESRGLHYSLDYPNRDDLKWRKDTLIRRPFAA